MASIARFGRRHFLRGAGGFTLAVPFLGSLRPRAARAAGPIQRRFVAMATDHGGIDPRSILPEVGPAATTRRLHPATARVPEHRITLDALAPRFEGGRTILSPVLQAPDHRLPPSRVEKLNVMTGFDAPVYMGHNRGAFLGNYAANDQGMDLHPFPMPTIDQLIATAPAFEVQAPRERTLHFGINYGVGSDVRIAASVARNGETFVPIPATNDVPRMWARLFESDAPTPDASRTPVVDRVLGHYRDLVSGAFGDAARLGRDDRVRLEHHMDLLAELQRKIAVTSACDDPMAPATPESALEALQLAMDVLAAGMRCGTCHVALVTAETELLTTDTGYTHWHNEVAHDGAGPYDTRTPEFTRMGERVQATFFEEVFARLVDALDVPEDEDGTYLDRSLLYWTMESGEETHLNFGMPIVTAGSAGGFFETGRFLDYRNHASDVLTNPRSPFRRPASC